MNPRDLYSVIFSLMALESGGIGALNKQLTEWQEEQERLEYMNSPARMAPDRHVPAAVAKDMQEVMKMMPPAPLKEK